MNNTTTTARKAIKASLEPRVQYNSIQSKEGVAACQCGDLKDKRETERQKEHNNQNSQQAYDVRNHVYDAQKGIDYYGVRLSTSSPADDSSVPLLYCPKGLDLRSELIRLGQPRLVKHLWKFYHVITLLYLHRWNKSSESEQYRPLMARVLRQALGSADAKKILEVLKSLEIVETNNHYVKGEHSKGYRICERFRTGGFRQVRPNELPRLPRAAVHHCRHQIETDTSPQHQHLLNILRRVELEKSSYEFIERSHFESQQQLDYYQRSAEWIRLGQWFFTYDKQTGRVFNNITSLPKELRPYLLVNGKSLVELDVVNCQPFLLLALYPGACPEREKFARVVCDGTFYECLDSALPVPFGEVGRQELKKAVFSQILFDRNRPTPTILNKAFQQLFPSLDARIREMKSRKHNQLALHLQRLEADLIIGGVVGQVALAGKFPVLTIHDSILTLPEHQCEVRELLKQEFTAKFGCVPKLRERLIMPQIS